MTTIDGHPLLDAAGRPTTIDELNARAIAWHKAHDPIRMPRDWWQQFYRDREALDLVEQKPARTRRLTRGR